MKEEIKTYSTKEQKLFLEILIADPELAVRSRNILDPEYFCENTLVLCHDGDY